MSGKEQVELFLLAIDEGTGSRRLRGREPEGGKELGCGQPAAQLHRQTALNVAEGKPAQEGQARAG